MHDSLPILREIYPCTSFSLLNLGKVLVVWRNKVGPETDFLRVFVMTKTAIRETDFLRVFVMTKTAI